MSKKLLFVANHSSHGGSLKMFTWLANAMSAYYNVTYCNLSNIAPFYELNPSIEYIQVNTKHRKSFVARNTIGFVKNIADIHKIIKRGNFDLVINFADHALYPLLFAKKLDKFKLLISQRVDPFSCDKKTDVFRLKLYKYVDGLVCQTKSAESFFNSAKYDNLLKRVIENPALCKTNLRWSKEGNKGYILSLARLDLEQKRQDVLIKAMEVVHKDMPSVKVKLFGKNVHDSLEKIQCLIENLNLTDCIEYCGVTDNSYEVLANARMLVMTSDYEGIPNAIIEAMEVGLPVISTDCKPGGARLLIDSDDKGLIVECDNSNELAKAIEYYINYPDIAAQKAENAHRSLERFSEKTIVNKWKNCIEDLIAR